VGGGSSIDEAAEIDGRTFSEIANVETQIDIFLKQYSQHCRLDKYGGLTVENSQEFDKLLIDTQNAVFNATNVLIKYQGKLTLEYYDKLYK